MGTDPTKIRAVRSSARSVSHVRGASVFAEIEGQRFVQRAPARVAYLRETDRWGYGLAPFGFKIVDHSSGTALVDCADSWTEYISARTKLHHDASLPLPN
jgi:hypothetical protein